MSKKIAFLSVLSIGAGIAIAQDYSLAPTYGQVSLDAGFLPDPYRVEIIAGGSIDASRLDPDCRGTIANAPDFRLNYSGGALWIGAISDYDTTLVVNTPDGQWYCDDDSGEGLNPLVGGEGAPSGQYDIWVGSYDGESYSDTTLFITEIEP